MASETLNMFMLRGLLRTTEKVLKITKEIKDDQSQTEGGCISCYTLGTDFLVQIPKKCVFGIFERCRIPNRDFTFILIVERFFTAFSLDCPQIAFKLGSNYVLAAFKLHWSLFKLRQKNRTKFFLRGLYEKLSRTTIPVQSSNCLFYGLRKKRRPKGLAGNVRML